MKLYLNCSNCGEKIELGKFTIGLFREKNGYIRHFCSNACCNSRRDNVKEYEIGNKKDLINSLRDLLKYDLCFDERKYIQSLLLRANRDEAIDTEYSSADIITDNKLGKAWCYICTKFVDSEINTDYYGQFVNEYDNYSEEIYHIIKADKETRGEILHHCLECNTPLIKKI